MALAPKTTRDASGATFSVNFEDNGSPTGPQTPVAQIVGPALTALDDANTQLADILDALQGTQTVQFPDGEPQDITGTLIAEIDADTYPGYKVGTNVPVLNATARYVRVARHVASTGSAVQAAAANANRVYLEVVNSSDTDQWFRFDGTAAIGGAGSILVKPGESVVYEGPACPTGAISVICGTASKNMSVWEA